MSAENNANGGSEFEQAIINGVADIFTKTLSAEGGANALNEMYDTIVNFVDDISAKVEETAPPTSPVDCGKACPHCCYKFETKVTPLEIFRIRDALIEGMTEESLKDILEQSMDVTGKKDAFVKGIQNGEIANDTLLPLFPCPLLKDDNCSVYDARPLECKAMNSYNAKACADRHENPGDGITVEGYGIPFLITGAATKGIIKGMEDMKLETGPVDLVTGLGIALTSPDARDRWLAGETVFAAAPAVIG